MEFDISYRRTTVKIKQFTWDIVDSNSWLIIDGNSGVLIDAVENTELYKCIGELEKLLLIITHAHFDHIYGLNHIRKLNTKQK